MSKISRCACAENIENRASLMAFENIGGAAVFRKYSATAAA
jgi:hypothetical protein